MSGGLDRNSIRRIGVFRALVLGDLLCAVPALRALRAGFPQAAITLIGLPWARALVERLDCVDDFIEFPGFPGLPEIACDVTALPPFLNRVQSRRFDLAIQLHGSGPIVNPLVAAFGARHTAGFFNDQAWVPAADAAYYRAWPEKGHEIERLLKLTDHLGLRRQGTDLEFPVRDEDRQVLQGIWPEMRKQSYICVHAGAQLPSRRWPPERFAAVADRLAEQGFRIVLTGGPKEKELAAAVGACMRHEAVDLSGRTSLWTLGALIEGADGLVCNDTGVSHIAAALHCPSVVVSSGADVSRWAPLEKSRHQVLWQAMPCRPCAYYDCPFGHGCAEAVEATQVIEAFQDFVSVDESNAPGRLHA